MWRGPLCRSDRADSCRSGGACVPFGRVTSMRSSNSGSHSAALVYAKMLCCICAILIIVLEVLSNYLLRQYSGTYLRVLQQYAEAVASRHANPGEPASVLIVGNSLPLARVDGDRRQHLTSSIQRIYPIFLTPTTKSYWFNALRLQFAATSR